MRINMLTNYLRKKRKIHKGIQQMKVVFESYLLYLVTRIYKAICNLEQNLLETFHVYVFLAVS